jgi:hypothetical protein
VCAKFGQNPLKDVDSRVFTRMLRKDERTEGGTGGSVTISLRNFVGEGMINRIAKSFPALVIGLMSYLCYLCLFAYSGVQQHILCCVFVGCLRLVYPMMQVSLDCPFLIAPSVINL